MKRLAAAIAATATVSIAAAVALRNPHNTGTQAAPSPTGNAIVVTVARRLLETVQPTEATLGYADARILSGVETGTVTALPATGDVVGRGGVLYRINERPVTLLYGTVPAWRALGPTDTPGQDIRQLKLNLIALGDDPSRAIKLDERWDWATTVALERWQRRRKQALTGTLPFGAIAFLPGPRRVGAVTAALGGAATGPLYTTTSLAPLAMVVLDARQQALARPGSHVQVRLPSGRVVMGVVGALSAIAAPPTTGAALSTPTATVSVSVRLPKLGDRGNLDGAPATVTFTTAAVRTLAVPVTALLARADGGFALELAATKRLVPVTTGVDAGGFVEVSGSLHAGLRVLAAAA